SFITHNKNLTWLDEPAQHSQPDQSAATTIESKDGFGPQPYSARADNFAGFTKTYLPFTSISSAAEDAEAKFSFSPRNMMSFSPTSTAPFSESLQQTVHPGVLSCNGYPLSDDNQSFFSDQFSALQNNFTSLSSNSRSQYGQITPLDELSPKSMVTESAFAVDDGDSPVKIEKVAGRVKPDNKRKRPIKAGKSSSRKHGRKTTVVENGDLDPEEKSKRDQFLDRNRLAAHKCRQKKKESITKLDHEFRDLSARNKYLHAEVQLLDNTLYELKDLIFQHTDCHYGPINEFIRIEAEKVQMRARLNLNPS
ncbi:Basic-leucine zipper (bZIP) transcription factor, partial [Macrophomina phaseolina MS6]